MDSNNSAPGVRSEHSLSSRSVPPVATLRDRSQPLHLLPPSTLPTSLLLRLFRFLLLLLCQSRFLSFLLPPSYHMSPASTVESPPLYPFSGPLFSSLRFRSPAYFFCFLVLLLHICVFLLTRPQGCMTQAFEGTVHPKKFWPVGIAKK